MSGEKKAEVSEGAQGRDNEATSNLEKDWINTAIVGIGRIYFDGHEKIYLTTKEFAPIALVDWDTNRAETAKAHILNSLKKDKSPRAEFIRNNIKVFKTFNDMLSELKGVIEFVDNCTHNKEHVPVSIKALENNIHVQTEKPPARNWAETEKLLEVAQNSKAFYQLAEHVCFEKPIIAMRKAILLGQIGDIEYVEINFGHNGPYWPFVVNNETKLPHFIDPDLGGGGCVQDLGPHGISQGLWPLGDWVEIKSCKTLILERRRSDRKMSGKLVDSPVDDYAVAEFKGINNKTGKEFKMKVTTSWCGQPPGEKVKIVGEKGTMVLGHSRIIKKKVPIIIDKNGKKKYVKLPKDKYHPWNSKIRETQMFANSIRLKKPSLVGPEYALRLQEVLSLHYFSKLMQREVTLEEMREWGHKIMEENGGDWKKAADVITAKFASAVDIK
ncbi:MAG: Gfo/Idh/MocA family protein [Promethearchaeota archaeon]